MNVPNIEMMQTIPFQTFKQLYATTDQYVIRFISFRSFKELGTFPRYPDHHDLTVSLADINERKYNDSLFIFISHCWLRGWDGAKDWDGRPHPDNAEGGKYALCVDGIDKVLQSLTSEIKECYLWLDFGCIDQNGNPANELKYLDRIVQVCDVLFTPIYDEYPNLWEIPTTLSPEGYYGDYQSPGWKGGQYSYLNRGWCRVEMFYGCTIPLLADEPERRGKMKDLLAFHREEGRRPHILYGSKEKSEYRSPVILPPLQFMYFDKHHPTKGHVTKESDKENIKKLVEDLEPYTKKAEEYYEGELYGGMKHGKGKCRFTTGHVYEGDFVSDKMHGKGKYTFLNGSVYEGMFRYDKKSGEGKYTFSNGDVYEGDWSNDERNGYGKYTYASNGDVYEGNYYHNIRYGKGKYTYKKNGEIVKVFEGEYYDNKKIGKGKMTYVKTGDILEGTWQNDEIYGKGKLYRSNGQILKQYYDNNAQLISEKEWKPKCVIS